MNKFDSYFMKVAYETAKLSYCVRKKVGSILVRDNRAIANGYNGTIPKMCNCCESKEFMSHEDSMTESEYPYEENGKRYRLVTNELTLHAEQNVLMFCAREGLSTKDTTLYVTLSPCKTCAKLLATAGVKRVVYGEEYKDTGGIDFLGEIGIIVEKGEVNAG
jgi:dCMP deaminase